ncbi:MAG: TadE family protein [Acidimicrobiales bacterium]
MRIRLRIFGAHRGAAIVEFALILPLLSMMALGMLTGGIALDRKQDINNASREAARFGATVAEHQCDDISKCDGFTWAELVRSLAVERSNGALVVANVCVALVSGPGWAPVAVSSTHTTKGGVNPCFVDNSSDEDERVQVSVSRTDKMEAVVFSMNLNLSSKAIARFET